MNNLKYLRILYHFAVFTVFLMQSKHSIEKYLEYPVVIQKSSTSINSVEKPIIQVCHNNFFDYAKAAELGYDWRAQFVAGMITNSTIPSWKGKHRNSTFQKIQDLIYETDFSKVTVSKPFEMIYAFGKGFCLQIKGSGNKLTVTSKEKEVKVYLSHKSTENRLTLDKESPSTEVVIGATSNATFEYKTVELFYEVQDNMIFEGTTCVDYRKQEESFGDCNYKVLAAHLHDIYGCYPPWMKLGWKNVCDSDVASKNVGDKTLNKTLNNLLSLMDGIKIDLMKQCLPSCYQLKVKWNEKEYVPNWKGEAMLYVYDITDIVPISKAVYSYDVFTLIVELGSALGLWLGIICSVNIEFKYI